MDIFRKLRSMLLISIIGLTSCQYDNQTKESTNNIDSSSVDSSAFIESTFSLPYQAFYNEETDRFEIRENTDSSTIAHNAEDLAKALNSKFPEITIIIERKKKDTLMVAIPQAASLTQTSGTTGATAYLAEATYAFTSLDSIRVVNFNFKEGDHAVPGPYTRASFSDFIK